MRVTKEFHDYVLENAQKAGPVTSRPMMGGYCVYFAGILIGSICDQRFFLKLTPSVLRLMPEAERALPYEGAKTPMAVVKDVEDTKLLASVFPAMAEELAQRGTPKRSGRRRS